MPTSDQDFLLADVFDRLNAAELLDMRDTTVQKIMDMFPKRFPYEGNFEHFMKETQVKVMFDRL